MKTLKFRNKFKVGDTCKVWVFSEDTEAIIKAKVTGIDGDYVLVEYIDLEKMAWLLQADPTFLFPSSIYFKDCE